MSVSRTSTEGMHIGTIDFQMIRAARGPLQLRRRDVVRAAQRQRLGPRQPRDRRPGGQRDRDDGVLEPGPQRRHEGERQDQRRERQEDVGDPHQHRVEPAAEVAGERPDREPDRPDDDRDQRDDRQRDPRAVDDAAEHVAPDLVGAEEVRAARRLQHRRQVLQVGVLRRDQRREHRHHDQHRDHHQPEGRRGVAREVPHDGAEIVGARAQAGETGGRGGLHGHGCHRVLGSKTL